MIGEPWSIVVMGVSGSGKSTIASTLAARFDLPYVDADALHSVEAVKKMAAGMPLTDEDRWPWLARVGSAIAASPAGSVVACSALRRGYRDVLRAHAHDIAFVHLHPPAGVVRERMHLRVGHFMPSALLDSQIATLEPLGSDERGCVVEADGPPDTVVAEIADELERLRSD